MTMTGLTRRTRRTRRVGAIAGVLLLAIGGCGDDDTADDESTDGDGAAVDVGEAPVDDAADDDDDADAADDDADADADADSGSGRPDVDNCTLLTDAEASALAGYELAAQAGDSPLGCPYSEPGAVVGDVIVRSARHDGDLSSLAEESFPNAASMIPVDGVGEEAIAVTTPAGDAISSILARQGDLVVELQVVFLVIEPDDTAAMQAAADHAAIALGRLVDAA